VILQRNANVATASRLSLPYLASSSSVSQEKFTGPGFVEPLERSGFIKNLKFPFG
jgi:hypothetical protein